MIVGTPTRLNLIPSGIMPVIYLNQTDEGYDKQFLIYNGDQPYDAPEGISVTIRGKKGDLNGITENVTYTVGSNLMTAHITQQMTAVAGDSNIFELVIVDTAGLRVGTINMIFAVEPDALGDAVISESEIGYAETVLTELQSVQAVNNQVQQNKANIAKEVQDRISAVNAEASARQTTDTALQNNINTESNRAKAAENTLQQNINAEASTRATADTGLQAQINQIVAPSGAAPSAAEVRNARIGADNVTYPTLGDAIRGQVTDLKSHIGFVFDSITGYPNYVIPQATNEVINASGEISASQSLRLTEFIELKAGVQSFFSFLRFTAPVSVRLAYYDTNQNFLVRIIKSATVADHLNVKIPHRVNSSNGTYTEAKYVRLCYEKDNGDPTLFDTVEPLSNVDALVKSQITNDFGYFPAELPLDRIVKLDGFYVNNDTKRVVDGDDVFHSFYYPCLPNQTYYIIKMKETRFGVGTTTDIPVANTYVNNYSYSARETGQSDENACDVKKVVTGATDKFIIIYYSRMSDGEYDYDAQTVFDSFRICGPVFRENPSYVTPQMFGIRANDPKQWDMTEMFTYMCEYMAEKGVHNIYIPSGRYWGSISIDGSTLTRINIFGDGSDSELCATERNKTCITITSSTSCAVHDLTLRSGNAPMKIYTLSEYLYVDWVGIHATQSRYLKIYNVNVHALKQCITLESCPRSYISSCIFANAIYDNSAFNDIDNSSYNCPGGNITYEQSGFVALCPYIYRSHAISMLSCQETTITDILMSTVGRGIIIGYGCSGAKVSNVELETAAGFGLWIRQGGAQVDNFRIDAAGLFSAEKAVIIDKVPGATNQISDYISMSNITILQCAYGAINIGEDVMCFNLENLSTMNNGWFYGNFFFYHMTEEEAKAAGWQAPYDITIAPGVNRSKIDGNLTAITNRFSATWPGYSNGVLFDEDSNHQLTQKYNDVNIRFAFDEQEPDGYDEMPDVIQYSKIPDYNHFVWNCTDIT